MDDLIRSVEEDFTKEDLPDIRPGDVVRIHEKLDQSSGKGRVQTFEGVVLKLSGSGSNKMISVRKVASGIGVEKTLPVHSPKVQKIELVKKGDVSQARPYYLRDRK